MYFSSLIEKGIISKIFTSDYRYRSLISNVVVSILIYYYETMEKLWSKV